MPNACCDFNHIYGRGHNSYCSEHPHKGKAFMSYPDGIGDVRFHYRDGSSHVIKGVQFDTVGGDKNGHRMDVTGDFENGNIFHVPNVLWWEVVYD